MKIIPGNKVSIGSSPNKNQPNAKEVIKPK
jgi:hypothetical protein